MTQALIANPFLTAEQLAASLGVKPDTVRDWGRRSLIPRIKVSHKVIRYDLDDVVAALKARAAEAIEIVKLPDVESDNVQTA